MSTPLPPWPVTIGGKARIEGDPEVHTVGAMARITGERYVFLVAEDGTVSMMPAECVHAAEDA